MRTVALILVALSVYLVYEPDKLERLVPPCDCFR